MSFSGGKGLDALGGRAYDALDSLCVITSDGDGPRWTDDDMWAYANVGSVELMLPWVQSEMRDKEQLTDLDTKVDRFRAALPYSRPEWRWFFGLTESVSIVGNMGWVLKQEDVLMIGGVKRAVYGRELARRWASWRRGIDEFAGQGGMVEATDALRDIVETTAPDYELPATYVAWRQQQSA